jgi:hypothetical protein
MNAPVLFLLFNRANTTRAVFEAIRQAQPSRLYVAADGPRLDQRGERERCDRVREIATDVDWPCELRTLFREKHLGCGVAVSDAIDWFFEHEDEGIILEDDCLPDLSFFRFCEELLARYRADRAVMMISGSYPLGKQHTISSSYFFSQRSGIWGWASWQRAWQHYDRKIGIWPELRNTEWLMRLGQGYKDFREFWTEKFDMAYAGKLDTWDYQWDFSIWLQNGLTIMPTKNLVKNIGFGWDATHTKDEGDWRGRLPLETISFPLEHPPAITPNQTADRWIDLNVHKTTSASKYRKILRTIPGLRWAVRALRQLAR